MDTYSGVGAALSQWEALEFELARIYSIFAGDPDGEGLREYGEPRIFSLRLSAFGTKAGGYFIRHPNQQTEGELGRIVRAATGFSDRRNEIAHGMVLDVKNIAYFRSRMPLIDTSRTCALLIPPWHTLRHHKPDGLPSYAYNANQMKEIATRIHDLEQQADAFRKALLVLGRHRP